jgi:hypothetical protein
LSFVTLADINALSIYYLEIEVLPRGVYLDVIASWLLIELSMYLDSSYVKFRFYLLFLAEGGG